VYLFDALTGQRKVLQYEGHPAALRRRVVNEE
jgi:hypothetical protein